MHRLGVLSGAVLLGACASLPQATMGYYLPTSDVTVKVVRTIACDAGNNPVIATSVTPTVTHHADVGAGMRTVALSALGSSLSDSDVKFEYYEDGRLAGVNATSTGQGEAILKTAFSIVGSLVKPGILGNFVLDAGQCKKIKDFGGGKPLTVTYSAKLDLRDNAVTIIKAEADSTFYADELKFALLPIAAVVEGREPLAAPVNFKPTGNDILVAARQPGLLKFKVGIVGATEPFWDDEVLVAGVGTDYVIPIPKPAPFGKKTLAVAFAESGAVKSVQYVSNTGSGQALNVLSAGLGELKGDTTADKAAAVKAEADLIAQQERLVACKADPKTCK